ncbi:serine aminopeptidase, s33 domain-containing protein [Ditylenchus destructor]|uniref:palmitoyl-protein hydrolase n=1 Tax=Ditylenchus destructor TaxID=166010 RepID=A0AAD4R9I6_9BILA|nr:serine aminopeptidase, s33 domain-containing protein [Ditylenchus destructor]
MTTAPASAQPVAPRAGISFRDLCALFCCPPFPSAIVSKLAFMPPEPSYKIICDDDNRTSLELIDGRAEWPHGQDELRNVEVFYTRTRRRNKIACMFVSPCGNAAHFTLLFSHGNAVDLGQMCSFYYGLGYRLGCNVFSYDYSGYGCSSGRPSEKNLYSDIAAALSMLNTKYQIPAEQVILYGQSIGTVPSVDLASKNPGIAALILHSALLSGMRVAFPGTQRTWCCDAFPSIEKIPRVQCPTLVIHGTDDDVIDFSHGLTIYEHCPSSVEPLWVPGAGHNDVELHAAYLDRLRAFIETEVLKNNTRDRNQANARQSNSRERQQTATNTATNTARSTTTTAT